jgi:hypothetical protein
MKVGGGNVGEISDEWTFERENPSGEKTRHKQEIWLGFVGCSV